MTQCDLMLVSHGHFDHIGSAPRDVANADALTIARATKPTWIAIHELSLWLETQLGDAGVEIIGMNKGGTVAARGLQVTMVHADHSAGDWTAPAKVRMYLGEPIGFVVELEDGMRVLFAGDTDVFGDMELLGEMHRPDVAFLPIGGHYTMGPAGAARSCRIVGVRAVVPIHYGTFSDSRRHARSAARRAARRWRLGRRGRAGPRRRHSPALMPPARCRS